MSERLVTFSSVGLTSVTSGYLSLCRVHVSNVWLVPVTLPSVGVMSGYPSLCRVVFGYPRGLSVTSGYTSLCRVDVNNVWLPSPL